MPSFNIVNSETDITLNKMWAPAAKFDSKNRIVDEKGKAINSKYNGRAFLMIEKKEYTYTSLERFCRGLLGTIAVICTLCAAVLLQSVRDLFTKEKINARFAISLTPEQKTLLANFSPLMIDALGGVKKILDLPVINNWNFDEKTLPGPVTIGRKSDSQITLIFCYGRLTDKLRLDSEILERDGNGWKHRPKGLVAPTNLTEIDFTKNCEKIEDGSVTERFMTDKISRLVNGRAVGFVAKYPNTGFNKNLNKDETRPDNSYLNGAELEAYMDLETIYYETKPADGYTDLILYNPAVSRAENNLVIRQLFPVYNN